MNIAHAEHSSTYSSSNDSSTASLYRNVIFTFISAIKKPSYKGTRHDSSPSTSFDRLNLLL